MGHKGKNLPGFERVCGSCQKRCEILLPDNITPLDVCTECWGKLNVVQRLMILQQAKQVKELNVLTNVVTEYIRSGDALRARRREHEGN